MPKRYITRKQNGGGFFDYLKKKLVPSTNPDPLIVPSTTPDPLIVPSTTPVPSIDSSTKPDPSTVSSTTPDPLIVPSTTPDTSTVPSTKPNPFNNNDSKQFVILSDKFPPDENKTYLVTVFLPNNYGFMKVNIDNNDVEINERKIKGIKEVETSSGNLVYEGTDVETEKPIILNKKFVIRVRDITTGGKRKSRRNKKSRQNKMKKSRQSRRR